MDGQNSILSGEAPSVDTGVVDQTEVTATVEGVGTAKSGVVEQSGEVSFDGLVGKDGMLSEGWRNALPENIRNERSLDSIKNFSTLAQSYVHAQKAIGANKVAIPGADATPEEKSAFYNALGRPEKAEDYKIETPADIPEGLVFNDESMNEFKKFAFEHGLSQEQANKAVEFQGQMLAKEYQASVAAAEAEFVQTEAKLKTEFGPNYNNTIAQCNKAMQTFGVVETLKNAGLLNNYEVIKMFSKIGGSLSESKLKGESEPVSSSAQSRYNDIIGNTDGAYYKHDHPMHEQTVAEVTRLLSVLNQK